MSEYLTALVLVSVVAALGSYASYNSEDKAVKAATSLILLYTAAISFSGLAGELISLDAGEIADMLSGEVTEQEDGYGRTAEEAYALGVGKAIAEKFGLREEDIKVTVNGFVFSQMRAEGVKVLLCGTAALADWRAIADYVEASGLGKCSVEVELG